MKNTAVVVNVTVANGTASGNNKLVLDNENFCRLIVNSSSPSNNHNNTGMVRVDVLVNNESVFKNPIAIDICKNRNVAFEFDGVPIPNLGGKEVVCKVISTQNHSAATEFDFTFIAKN